MERDRQQTGRLGSISAPSKDGIGIQSPIKTKMSDERREKVIDVLSVLLLSQMRREVSELPAVSEAGGKVGNE